MKSKKLVRVVATALLMFCAVLPAAGSVNGLSEVAPDQIGYSVAHWTVENELPTRVVTSLAQTPDGFLWCGSTEGLLRFDGTQFQLYTADNEPALEGVQILEMRCDLAGRLWIAGIDGELVVYETGRFHRIKPEDGMPAGGAEKLGESVGADFWVKGRTNDDFYQYHAGSFKTVTYPGLPATLIDRFLADDTGVQWGVHEKARVMVRFAATGPEMQPLIGPAGQTNVWAGRLFRLLDGHFAVSSSHGIYALKGSRWVMEHKFEPPLARSGILDVVQDWQSNFWISVYGQGLFLSEPDGQTRKVRLPDMEPHPFIRALLLDGEGNVWVAGDNGLYQLRRNAFRPEPGLTLASQSQSGGTSRKMPLEVYGSF